MFFSAFVVMTFASGEVVIRCKIDRVAPSGPKIPGWSHVHLLSVDLPRPLNFP